VKKGSMAGTIFFNGRNKVVVAKRLMINGKSFYNARIIFMMKYGYTPKCVSHKDGNTLNNHIENLRAADKSDVHCFSAISSRKESSQAT